MPVSHHTRAPHRPATEESADAAPYANARVWETFVVGLLVLLLCSLVGIVWTVADGNDATSPDVLVSIFTSTLTGLLGLFVRSPMR
jgi:hypothetical protein